MHHMIHNVQKNTKYPRINVEIMICDSRISTWFSDSSSDFKWFLEPLTWFGIAADPLCFAQLVSGGHMINFLILPVLQQWVFNP